MKRVTDLEYWMDGYLISILDTACYNMDNDWDFVFCISGDGMVRVGKSCIAQQAGYYVAYKKGTPFTVNNVVFSGAELIKTAHSLPANSVIIYDEARGELDSKKTMESITKTLLDFFAECGMYNHFIILVLPDFFEMSKSIAISRSDGLINVFRTAEKAKDKEGNTVLKYKRGFFEFYNRHAKKKLFIHGKKNNNEYNSKFKNFHGEFREFWVLDRAEYGAKKRAFLQRDRQKTKSKDLEKFIIALRALTQVCSQREAAELLTAKGMKISHARINQLLKQYRETKASNEVMVKGKRHTIDTPKLEAPTI
jgi:hypothetical protein